MSVRSGNLSEGQTLKSADVFMQRDGRDEVRRTPRESKQDMMKSEER